MYNKWVSGIKEFAVKNISPWRGKRVKMTQYFKKNALYLFYRFVTIDDLCEPVDDGQENQVFFI